MRGWIDRNSKVCVQSAGKWGGPGKAKKDKVWKIGKWWGGVEKWNLIGLAMNVPVAGLFFFPQDRRLELGTEGYSPKVLEKIEYAGANAVSFEQAAKHMEVLGEMKISSKHMQRLTERLGAEREQMRDRDVEKMKAGELQAKILNRPKVCAVHVDAGKVQTRAEDGQGPGVRGAGWNDTKVACLVSYQGVEYDTDPEPEVPKKLVEREAVKQLCKEMAAIHGKSQERKGDEAAEKACQLKAPEAEGPKQEVMKSEPLVRTAVATQEKVERFGWMVAAEAMKRGFYEAVRKALLGDGGNWIEPLGDLHFPGWTQILDFLHLAAHLYGAAQAAFGKDTKEAWAWYKKLVTKAWGGQVGSLIKMLEDQIKRIGKPVENAAKEDPRKIVASTLDYVLKNAKRMNYPQYRQWGLPISSAPVESLIKQFNQRIKGTEKFWQPNRVEAILQSRAAYLSQDNRAEEFWKNRKPAGKAVGQKRLQRSANPLA